MTINDTLEEAKLAVSSPDGLSKQGARAAMVVLLLALLMALSAILLILGSDGSGPASAQQLPETQACLDRPAGGGNVPQKPTEVPPTSAAESPVSCLIPAHLLKP